MGPLWSSQSRDRNWHEAHWFIFYYWKVTGEQKGRKHRMLPHRADSGWGKAASVKHYRRIRVLARIVLCGATSAHRSEIHLLQAHSAIHRRETSHTHMAAYIGTHTHTEDACIHTNTSARVPCRHEFCICNIINRTVMLEEMKIKKWGSSCFTECSRGFICCRCRSMKQLGFYFNFNLGLT